MPEREDNSPLPDRDRRVLDLYEKVLEIEQRLIPTGLHVFGRSAGFDRIESLLQMIASFERVDPRTGENIPALTDLVAASFNLPPYSKLLTESGSSAERLAQREELERVVSESIRVFVSEGAVSAASSLEQQARVPADRSAPVFSMLAGVRSQLETSGELDSLVRALKGEYIEPGPGGDIIQNPEVLPTGRNTYAINPYSIPSELAMRRAQPVVRALLERHEKQAGRLPETIGMVLWGIDNIKTQGEAVAQALSLLGVRPRRDALNRATAVEVIPLDELGRPRIDVVMTVSGIFRDLFAPTMALLDRAVRTVAELDEPEDRNFVRRHSLQAMRENGESRDDAATRVFSNAPGNYGTNVNFMVLDSQWERASELGDLFVTRKCFAYGRERDGEEARALMERALSRVDVAYQNIDSTEVGITDIDHYFEYLGGMTRAVEKSRGERPAIYLSDTTSPAAKVRTLEETVQLETRTKTLNPKWYEGMLKHGFSGVAEIEHHLTNTFGWSATADAVDDWVYDQVAETFVLDREMLARLQSLNPHSVHSMVGRLLEASGRGLWNADPSVADQLRDIYAGLEDRLEGVAR
ncbi:MAG TPA: cobaltochelatase subunit CobN [Blastocatellia bacterium]|nr:cobaltochelatase subunit CobN [Blastocatellia bacterium]